jgi:hypothetical protein
MTTSDPNDLFAGRLDIDLRLDEAELNLKENFAAAVYSHRHNAPSRRVKVDRSDLPLIEVLRFADDTLARDLASDDLLTVARALRELERSLIWLVKSAGHSQFWARLCKSSFGPRPPSTTMPSYHGHAFSVLGSALIA